MDDAKEMWSFRCYEKRKTKRKKRCISMAIATKSRDSNDDDEANGNRVRPWQTPDLNDETSTSSSASDWWKNDASMLRCISLAQ